MRDTRRFEVAQVLQERRFEETLFVYCLIFEAQIQRLRFLELTLIEQRQRQIRVDPYLRRIGCQALACGDFSFGEVLGEE